MEPKERGPNLQGKSGLCNWVTAHADMNSALPDIPPVKATNIYDRRSGRPTICLLDGLTRLKGVDGENTSASELVSRLRTCIEGKLNLAQLHTFVLVMDKAEFMPVAKGAEQAKRIEQSAGLSTRAKVGLLEEECFTTMAESMRPLGFVVPEGMSLQEAVEEKLITPEQAEQYRKRQHTLDTMYLPFGDERHYESRNRHLEKKRLTDEQRAHALEHLTLLDADFPQHVLDIRDADVPGVSILHRALASVAQTKLPDPWGEWISSNRAKIMRYLTRALLFDLRNYVCVPDDKLFIMDGGCVFPDHLCCTDEEKLSNPKRPAEYTSIPLVFRAFNDIPEKEHDNYYGSHWNAKVPIGDNVEGQMVVESDEEERNISVAHFDRRFENKNGEADLAMFSHIKVLLELAVDNTEPEVIEIVTTDTDAFIICMKFFALWEKNMISPLLIDKPLPQIYLTRDPRWESPHTCGSMDLTATYKRIVKMWLHGNSDSMFSFVGAFCCGKHDYAIGFYFMTGLNIVKTFLKYQVVTIVRADGSTYVLPKLTDFVTCVDVPASKADASEDGVTPEKREVTIRPMWVRYVNADDGSENIVCYEKMMRMSASRYVDLITLAYYDLHATVLKKKLVADPTRYPLDVDALRTAIDNKIIKGDLAHYVLNKHSNPIPRDQFDSVMRMYQKRVPPSEELLNRSLNTWNSLSMIFQVGKDMQERDLLTMGYARINPHLPLSRFNIKSLCSMDQGREEIWIEQKRMLVSNF